MTRFLTATALTATLLTAPAAFAEPEKYVLDSSHSQILFSYDHMGFSRTWNIFSGFEGEIMFDQDDPANSSVTVSFPVTSLLTGWEERYNHFMSDDFFGAEENETVSFTSTEIEVTGDTTAKITGDFTLNGITKPVTLDAELTQAGSHPIENKPWAGFSATTTLKRSDYDMGMFAPVVGDEVDVQISIEAMKDE